MAGLGLTLVAVAPLVGAVVLALTCLGVAFRAFWPVFVRVVFCREGGYE